MSTSLTIDTLRNRAAAFAKKFAHITAEKQHDQDFMREFYAIFGVTSQRIEWQYPVKANKSTLWIDGLITGILLIEMKSAGKNLDEAYQQAAGYIGLIKPNHQPDYVLVSDFANLHLYNRVTGEPRIAIKLADLPQYIEPFLFLAGYEKLAIEKQERINKLAAEKMADLHDVIKATGYDGKDLESYLVRLLFCLFAEDTGLFGENGSFLDYLHHQTKADGSDLHGALSGLFDTLNKPDSDYLANHPQYNGQKRLKNLSEHLSKFPYINGALFEGSLSHCQFDEHSRALLMECAKLDWSEISPAIFGSLFQAIMHFDDELATAKTKKRREFGAHYTSEENILKTINPLFMDDLRAEFAKCKTNKTKLAAFHQKLARLNFFDPACGCGNFLIIAYRELRLLELEVINAQFGDKQVAQLDVDTLILCNVHQFHGIDIDESAVQIATLALWLVDHQMNLRVKVLGAYYHRIPLKRKANIVCANALQLDWESVIPPSECSFIMGNPPFIGKKEQSPQQKADIAPLVSSIKGAGVLDYVTAWYIKATAYIKNNPTITAAFVSTNSICQGEQVCILWGYLSAQGVKIYFAHRTFQWSNEGRGVAAVHCVIIGFGLKEPSSYRLFDYGDNIKGEPIEVKTMQINPYLVDAPSVIIENRKSPINNAPDLSYGSFALDSGHYTLIKSEVDEILSTHPNAEKYIRQFIGGVELLHNKDRYCLWLLDASPADIQAIQPIKTRVELVQKWRKTSQREITRQLATTPTIFAEIRQPKTSYLAFPTTSSENRYYLPIAFLSSDVIASNQIYILPNATRYHFGILTSTMHNAWMRTVCGRLKSDYRYSASIVYNNFPWATPDTKQIKSIEEKAQAVLDARAEHKTSTLADLYHPLTMPPNLVKAHNALDKAVDAAYGYKGSKDDAARVAFLFELYQKLTAPLMETEQVKKPRKSRRDRLA
jgi:hypothetical protein